MPARLRVKIQPGTVPDVEYGFVGAHSSRRVLLVRHRHGLPCPVFAGLGDANIGAAGDGFCEDDGSAVKTRVAGAEGGKFHAGSAHDPASWY